MADPYHQQGAQSHLSALFDGQSLFLKNVRLLKGKTEIFKAASGNAKRDPIPNGTYWFQSADVFAVTAGSDWTPSLGFSKPMLLARELLEGRPWGALATAMTLHAGAWGEFRIPIRQTRGQQAATGRSAMFIHGGDTFGSAGCIDLSHGIGVFVEFLRREHPNGENRWIELNVSPAGTR